jgi:mandelate racemase
MMPDAGRIGGVTGWLRAASMAQAANIKMSSHLYPEISAHLLAVTPTAAWLEYVDWATPILADPPAVRSGKLSGSERPGTGISWNEDAVDRFAVAL